LPVVATLPDGRVIAKASIPSTTFTAAGSATVTITFTDLKLVEAVLEFSLSTTTATNVTVQNVSISKNSISATIYVAAATTVSGEALAIGF
jgi:hypothetical protein